jgi:hypothetical protein
MVLSPTNRKQLVEAALSGKPPVTAISDKLLALMGKDAKALPVKSHAGLCVRAALELEGFHVEQTGVRIPKDPVFRTGSVYSNKTSRTASDPITRFVNVLTDDEAKHVAALIKRRFASPPRND